MAREIQAGYNTAGSAGIQGTLPAPKCGRRQRRPLPPPPPSGAVVRASAPRLPAPGRSPAPDVLGAGHGCARGGRPRCSDSRAQLVEARPAIARSRCRKLLGRRGTASWPPQKIRGTARRTSALPTSLPPCQPSTQLAAVMAALIGALGAWPARLCTVLPRLSAVPPPLAAWPSPRTLGTLRVACSASAEAPGQGAKLVSGGRRRLSAVCGLPEPLHACVQAPTSRSTHSLPADAQAQAAAGRGLPGAAPGAQPQRHPVVDRPGCGGRRWCCCPRRSA